MTVEQFDELKQRVLARGPAMTHQEFLTAAIQDARTAYAGYEGMRTDELLQLQAAHQSDQGRATSPESLAFGGGRLALIAAVLSKRVAEGRVG